MEAKRPIPPATLAFSYTSFYPMLYEDAKQMVEYVGQALKQTSREATILLYAPALDPHLQTITELADRVFCIYEGERAPVKGRAKIPGDQATLEAYS